MECASSLCLAWLDSSHGILVRKARRQLSWEMNVDGKSVPVSFDANDVAEEAVQEFPMGKFDE